MKKLLSVFALAAVLSCNYISAQESTTSKIGTLKTNDGNITAIYDYLTKDNDSWSFHDEHGKFKVVKTKNIVWVMLGKRRFLQHNIRDNNKEQRILELITMTDKYKLFYYEGHNNFIYIFDMNDKLIVEPIKLIPGAEGGSKKNNEQAAQTISGYFSECSDLHKMMNENMSNRKDLFFGIGYNACPGAANIETIFK